MTPALAAALVDELGRAFEAGDPDAVLGQFCDDGPVLYAGSEAGELAAGHEGLRSLLADLFTRDERYSWRSDEVHVVPCGTAASLLAEVTLLVRPYVEGRLGEVVETVPYRISGALERVGESWRWRLCQGSEPTEADPHNRPA
jgi:SnoaL-like domain